MNGKNTIKKITLLLLLISASLFLAACGSKVDDKELNKLSLLNDKYGLIKVESLSEQNEQEIASLFLADSMKVDLFNALKPEKEIIVKMLSNNDKDEELQNLFILRLKTDANIDEIVKSYEGLEVVNYAEPNYEITLGEVSKIQRTKKKIIRLQETKDDAVVAVIDSGVDVEHKLLKGKTVEGWDFIADKENMDDEFGHGTHVAGIIVNNSSAKIMPVKFTDGKEGKMSNLLKGIKFAVDNKADIINLSLGLEEKTKALQEAINYAEKKGVIVVAAAGNNNSNKQFYPAAYSTVYAVAALNNKGEKLYQSNYGKWIDYSVKAQDIYSTLPDNKYGYKTGTSQAAPYLSAEIADILAANPKADKTDINTELEKSSIVYLTGKYSELLGRELVQ